MITLDEMQRFDDHIEFGRHKILDAAQYLFGSSDPWTYHAEIGAYLLREAESLSIVFVLEQAEAVIEFISSRASEPWVFDEYIVSYLDERNHGFLSGSNVYLIPGTRKGISDAAMACILLGQKSSCRILRGNVRANLTVGKQDERKPVRSETFGWISQVFNEDWIMDYVVDYDFASFTPAPSCKEFAEDQIIRAITFVNSFFV